MGVSTDAILFYGFAWEVEEEPPYSTADLNEEDEEDWEDLYARAMGVDPPELPYPDRRAADGYSEPTDYTADEREAIQQHDEYRSRKREVVVASGCEIDTHCSGDYPMYYLAITESRLVANRGCPQPVPPLTISPEWNRMLNDVCKALEIDTEGMRCGWWLVSYWG